MNDLVEIATPGISDYKQSILSFKLREVLEGTLRILESDYDFGEQITLQVTDQVKTQLIGDPSLLRSALINLVKGVAPYRASKEPLSLAVEVAKDANSQLFLSFVLHFSSERTKTLEKTLLRLRKQQEQRHSYLSNAHKLITLSAGTLRLTTEGTSASLAFTQPFSKDPTRAVVPQKE